MATTTPWCAYPKGVGNVIIKAGCVHIIKDFLPAAVAMRMHAELLEAWQRTYNGTRDDFYFTTNCKLLRSCGPGGAVRHDNWRQVHRAHAEANRAMGMYTMARHELNHKHSLHHEALQHVVAGSGAIGRALGRPVRQNSTKHFLTAFGPRDFLTTHTDNANGDAAFVLNLTPNWNPRHGGHLSFRPSAFHHGPLTLKRAFRHAANAMASTSMSPDYAVAPAFNSLTLFIVEQGGPLMPHEVGRIDPNANPMEPRLAVTGWVQLEGPRAMTGLQVFNPTRSPRARPPR